MQRGDSLVAPAEIDEQVVAVDFGDHAFVARFRLELDDRARPVLEEISSSSATPASASSSSSCRSVGSSARRGGGNVTAAVVGGISGSGRDFLFIDGLRNGFELVFEPLGLGDGGLAEVDLRWIGGVFTGLRSGGRFSLRAIVT